MTESPIKKQPALCLNCGKWFLSAAIVPECHECRLAGVLSGDCVYQGKMTDERVLDLRKKLINLQCRIDILVREKDQHPEEILRKANNGSRT